MALQLADRVQQTGTANTTVSFNLSGSVSGYQSFSSAITTGNTTYYAASDGTNWEVGIGTLTSSSLLTRTTIISSSNSGSAVSTFGSSVNIFVTQPAENTVVSSNNPGTSGYVLTSQGTGVAPIWSAGVGTTLTTTDTSSASTFYPTFTPVDGGSSQTVYNNSGLKYVPSKGDLTAPQIIASNGLIENSSTVSTSYTVPTGSNAMSVGPMTVNTGISVTVSSGQRWVIL